MTTTTSAEDDDRKKRIERLKSVPTPATTGSGTAVPVSSTPPEIDPKLLAEKLVDLQVENRALLVENQQMQADNRQLIATLKTSLPGIVAEEVRKVIHPVIAATAGQRRDIDLMRQQSDVVTVSQADTVGSLRALCWILGVVAVGTLAVLGRGFL